MKQFLPWNVNLSLELRVQNIVFYLYCPNQLFVKIAKLFFTLENKDHGTTKITPLKTNSFSKSSWKDALHYYFHSLVLQTPGPSQPLQAWAKARVLSMKKTKMVEHRPEPAFQRVVRLKLSQRWQSGRSLLFRYLVSPKQTESCQAHLWSYPDSNQWNMLCTSLQISKEKPCEFSTKNSNRLWCHGIDFFPFSLKCFVIYIYRLIWV